MACYVKNDSPHPFKGSVRVSSVKFATGVSTAVKHLALDMPAGAGTTQWFPLGTSVSGASEMLMVVVADSSGVVQSTNPVGFAYPKNMALPNATVTFTVGVQEEGVDSAAAVPIVLHADQFALYVTLTTLAQGRFDDNAFVMMPGPRIVLFHPFEGFAAAELVSSLRVEHAAAYAL